MLKKPFLKADAGGWERTFIMYTLKEWDASFEYKLDATESTEP